MEALNNGVFPKVELRPQGLLLSHEKYKIQISPEEPSGPVCRSLVKRKAPFPKRPDKKTVMEHLRNGKSQNRYTRPC